MPRSKSGNALQIDEHLDFQRALGIAQRIGWGVLFLGVFVAVTGALGGGGPLSQASAAGDALRVQYPRFARHGTPLKIELQVATAEAGAQPFSITLGGAYGDRLHIDSIVPAPARAWSGAHGMTLEFTPAPGPRQVIRIAGDTDTIGSFAGEVGLGQRPPLRLRTFVYP